MLKLENIGILSFKTNDHHFEGDLFKEKEDFEVDEIEIDGKVLSTVRNTEEDSAENEKNVFLVFTLVKRGLSTPDSLRILSKENNLNIKRFGYHGNKDRNAVTAQRISVFKGDDKNLKKEYLQMFLKDFTYNENGCKIGELYGNRFKIKIRNFIGLNNIDDFIKAASTGVPNFYGPQHFGSSGLNIEVSKAILKRDFKSAIAKFLLDERDESVVATRARKDVRESFANYIINGEEINKEAAGVAINNLPGFFYLEKKLLYHLLANSQDYIGAFRLIPKFLRLLILQSYQAYFFNLTLSAALKTGKLPGTIPTVGYDLDLERLDTEIKKEILIIQKSEGFENLSGLKIKEMPEVSLKTFNRETLVIPENLSYTPEGKDVVLRFDLKKGAYATILLLEMFKRF